MSSEDHTTPLLVHSSLYVLELVGGRFYIGISMNLSHRLAQHFSKRGSQVTRMYPPVRVAEVIYHANLKVEREKTLEYVRRYGFNFPDGSPRVRGAGWSSLRAKAPVGAMGTATPAANSGQLKPLPLESSRNTAICASHRSLPLKPVSLSYLQAAGQRHPPCDTPYDLHDDR